MIPALSIHKTYHNGAPRLWYTSFTSAIVPPKAKSGKVLIQNRFPFSGWNPGIQKIIQECDPNAIGKYDGNVQESL